MRTAVKATVSLVSYAAMLINQVQAYLPPIDFESPGYVAGQDFAATSGWQLISGTAAIVPGAGMSGSQGLKIPKNAVEEASLVRLIDWDVEEKTAFIDLHIQPAANPLESQATFVANGAELAFQISSSGDRGEIWIQNGNEGPDSPAQWVKTVGTFSILPDVTTGVGFSRITLRQDYERDLWDLFIDGKLAAANLAFEGRGANLDNLRIYGSMAGDTFVDDLSARPDNMLFPDKDKDGLPDGWEIANGSNPNSYDRDALKPDTDKSFLDLYMDSLWPGGLNGSRTFPPGGEIPPLTIPAAHQPVTSLKGALSVGSDGSGTYSVPIDLPVGSGGMVPQISLNYSSNSGNGPVGLGWSVGGFQSITRGAATSGKDGFAGAVRFNGDDRFFFNGERLVCVKGIYGGKDSEYRTEIDSFARIRLFGGNQNSPDSWWQVETKAGLIIELGNAPDARVLAPDAKGPVSWDVSRVRDTVGNYYLVKWAGNTTADNLNLPDRRLERVSYTGNIRKSLSPYCHVDFEYESRPDKRTGYTPSGTYFEAGKRLKGIKVNTNGLVNHTYHLKYKQSAQSNRSLLTSIGKSHGNNGTVAVAETTFDWQGLKAGEAKWGKAEQTTLLKYNLNKLDADTALINSVVTTDSTRIRLDGDVARVHTLGAPVSIVPGSFVEFSVKAAKLDNGAYLIFDNNDVYEGINGQFAIRIKPPNAPDAAIPPRRQVIYPADSEGSVTYRIAFQGDPYKPFNYTSGTFTKIALVNYDNNIGNGTGFVEFNNIRVGTAKELDSNSVAPIVFPETNDIPRFTDNKGNQRGNIILDVDADGLPDISDFRVKYYGDSTLKPVAERQPVGKVYRNTGGASRWTPR